MKKFPLALVYWEYSDSGWDGDYYAIERKKILWEWNEGEDYKMVCNDQPRRVLEGMLKLLKED